MGGPRLRGPKKSTKKPVGKKTAVTVGYFQKRFQRFGTVTGDVRMKQLPKNDRD